MIQKHSARIDDLDHCGMPIAFQWRMNLLRIVCISILLLAHGDDLFASFASVEGHRVTSEDSRASFKRVVLFLETEVSRIEVVAEALIRDLEQSPDVQARSDAIETHRLHQEFQKRGPDTFEEGGSSCLSATEAHRSYVLKRVHRFAYRQLDPQSDFIGADVSGKLARLQLLSDQRSEIRGWIRQFRQRCPVSGNQTLQPTGGISISVIQDPEDRRRNKCEGGHPADG